MFIENRIREEHINSRRINMTYMTDIVKGKTKDMKEDQVFLFRVKENNFAKRK